MSKYPNINIVEQPTNWDPPTGMKAAQDIIAANPDLKALHCVSDAVTLAAYQAIKTAGKEDQIIVTSYDGNEDAIKAVEVTVCMHCVDRCKEDRILEHSNWLHNSKWNPS